MAVKHLLAGFWICCAASAALAGPSVGVSIGINEPGIYGRVDVGRYPSPELVYAQPVIVAPTPITVQRRPIYVYVPEAQQRDWRRYCGRYYACGQPVYFVRERWVRERWEHEHPHWRERHHEGHDRAARRDRHEDRHDNGRHRGRDDDRRGH